MKEIIFRIQQSNINGETKLKQSASIDEIIEFESKLNMKLPNYFKEFYSICNGFECEEDIFNFLSLSDIIHEPGNIGSNWFYFSEYMLYSDMWGLRCLNGNKYEIFNGSYPNIALSSSLLEFLEHLAVGHIFEKNGLYEWHKEKGINL